ncbi:MAG TPA: periplasmic heavy metal sensor [Blastocatellia bacterium]|nr:periplasmic heavy metal sensor [Blastocatellia bacterium]
METNSKRKWQIRASVALIFLLGFLAGALVLNYYHRRQSQILRGPGRYEQVIKSLNLTAEQKTQVEQIMAEARGRMVEIRRQSEPQIGAVRQQTDERLKAVLTPEQWAQWQRMTNELRSRRRWERPR